MNKYKLSDYTLKKGKLLTPFNNAMSGLNIELSEASWFRERLPNYIWLALIFEYYGTEAAMNICGQVINTLAKSNIGLKTLKISEIINKSEKDQKKIYEVINRFVSPNALEPLTVLLTPQVSSTFYEHYNINNVSIKDRLILIERAMKSSYKGQSNRATDIRFLTTYYLGASGSLIMSESQAKQFARYPDTDNQQEKAIIGSLVRSMEVIDVLKDKDNDFFVKKFWEEFSNMTECEIYTIEYDTKQNTVSKMETYLETLEFYNELFLVDYMFDDKMEVLLGITTYSYKRLKEIVDHELYNAIVGRSTIRVLIENYIMMKYLSIKESDQPNIWHDFKVYGLGQYELISKKWFENKVEYENPHVNFEYLSVISKEIKDENILDMDISYFMKKGIRDKAIEVDEKKLYDLFYDYDSAFEHGLWGAIRESSMLRCDQISHQLHTVPDVYDQQKLETVWYDAKMIMDKIFNLMAVTYGTPVTTEVDINE